MKLCIHCGAEISDESAFCTSCGQPLPEAPQQPVMPAFPETPDFAGNQQAMPQAPVFAEAPQAPVFQEPYQQQADQPTYAEQYAAVTAEAADPAAAQAPVKKGKGKLIALIIAGVLLIGAGVGAYFLATWYYSPEQKVLRMVEDKQYTDAQTLVAQNYNLRYNKDLENQVSQRLEDLKREFTEKVVDYTAATAELDSIEKLELEGLKTRIPEYRAFMAKINQSRADFATAEQFFADGNYPEALEYFRKVDSEDPDHSKATQRITDTVTAYRKKVLTDAAAYAETGAYTSAVTTLDAGLVVLPGDADLTSQRAIYEKKNLDSIKSTALTEASNAAGNKDYENALSILDKYIFEYGSDAEVSVKRNEYLESYVDAVLANVDQLQNNKDFAGAVKAIDGALKVATGHTRLQNRRKAVLAAFAEYTCAEADKLAGEKKFDEAVKLINDALKIAPEDKTLTDKKAEIEEKKPIPITSLDALNTYYWKWNEGTAQDPFGNDYSTSCNYIIRTSSQSSSSPSYIEYRVYEKYSRLTGIIAPHANIGEKYTGVVQVYADDVLVYTSPTVTQKTDAFNFDVDISGADYIKIVIKLNMGYDGSSGRLLIADVQLCP